jgi:hypothetical protein
MFVMKSDDETESTWSKEKKLFVFGEYTRYMSMAELEAMNGEYGLMNTLIRMHREGRPISRQDAEWCRRGTLGVLPSVCKEDKWDREHKEGRWEEYYKEQERKQAEEQARRDEIASEISSQRSEWERWGKEYKEKMARGDSLWSVYRK